MEVIKDVIVALGGIAGVIIIFLAFGRKLIEQWIIKFLENTSSKAIAKYTNSLERSTTAYKVLLNKELDYYESVSKYVSEFVVGIQDVSYYIQNLGIRPNDNNRSYEIVRKTMIDILEKIPAFKSKILINQCYNDKSVHDMSIVFIQMMQNDSKTFYDVLLSASRSNLVQEEIEKCKNISDQWSETASKLMYSIEQRLHELSEQ